MTPLFWNYFLAAELPGPRARAILAEVEEGPADPTATLLGHRSLTPAERERIRRVDPRNLEAALAKGVELLLPDRFPPLLAEGPNTYPALFVWGDRSALEGPTIAIVGTRGASAYGKAVATKFGEWFARTGVTVVSGGAAGIDAAALKGALDAGGRAVAVLPCGVDVVYPAANGPLFARIRESGCLVSQFAVARPANNFTPVLRNDLIAALSLGVVVVEAPENSGALRTAHAAIERNRLVFVVPANIGNPNFRGSHALIREGAILVDHPDQVLNDLGLPLGMEPAPAPTLPPEQEKVLRALEGTSSTLDEIARRTGLYPNAVMALLTDLEMAGLVIRNGPRFERAP